MIEDKLSSKLNMDIVKNTILNFIVPIVCIGISALLGFVVIYSHYKNYPIKKAEMEEKTVLRDTLTSKVKRLNKLQDFKAMLDENSELVDKVLVSEANVPQLLDQVNQIATNAGLKVSRLSYSYGGSVTSSSGPTTSTLSKVEVSLGVEGSYDQLIVFLNETENAARVLTVTSYRYGLADNNVISAVFSIESAYQFVESRAVTDEPIEIDITRTDLVNFINKLKGLRYYEFVNPDIVNQATRETNESTPSAGQ